MKNPRFLTLAGMILAAALSRILPHPWNFSPVGAMALFAGAQFSKRSQAFLVPFAALLLSDIILGFYPEMIFIYASFAVNVLLGHYLVNNISVRRVGGASVLGSIQFFIVTNFGVWTAGLIYPRTLAGLSSCYAAGLPFFRFTVLGDLFFSALLFGSFALAQKAVPRLSETHA